MKTPRMEIRRREFIYDYYKEFISHLREIYQFTTFQEGKKNTRAARPLVIMRHDIDMDLEAAVRISLLEKELGIHSTYFFLIRCPLYNVFSGDGSDYVKRILGNGHHFGLHFDCALYQDISSANINRYILKEAQLLEQFFENPIEAISFHRPGPLELNGIELEKWPNSYEKIFLENFEYFSDSRGNWARGNPLQSEAFLRKKNLQILVHPIWWNELPMAPYRCLASLVERIGNRVQKYLSENCQVWNAGKQEIG